MLPLNLKTYYCFCLFLLGINHLLAQTFFQSPHSYQRVDVQINAGADTTVCGYKHHLIGDPIGGTWTIDCVSAPAVVVISPSASDTTLITVAACGMYDFIYSVDVGGGIMTQDTIRIAFQDPNSATQNVFVNYAYIIDIGDCPPIEDWEVNYTPPTCVNNEQVGGSISFNDGNSLALMNPPTPQETTVDGEIVITCWRQLFIPEVFDTFLSDCLADSIHISEVITNDTTDAMFTITQQDYIMIDPMTGDTLVNLYTQ
ncbi:MAG: hypothetical protein KA974_08025, partial [Saprospiraceae bacterium]|nr:hypothetical protein [Saprospiraceae bacterium]